MNKWKGIYVQSQKSKKEQDMYKRYWHGRVCQQCKSFAINYAEAVVAYRIPPGIQNIEEFKPTRLYKKPNWAIVCSQSCADALRREYDNPVSTYKLIRYIDQWIDPRLSPKPKDGYREEVLRFVGIDPEVKWDMRVYDIADWTAGIREFFNVAQ